jgi:uncharacterized membrane protein
MECAGELARAVSSLRWQDIAFVYGVWAVLRMIEFSVVFLGVGVVGFLRHLFFPDRES